MGKTRAALMAFLDGLAIKTETVEHPPLFTVAESQRLRGELPGGHTKNLFLKDKKGAVFLLVAEEEADIDMKSLHRVIGSARLSFGKPELLEALLGVTPGSVTPFAVINDAEQKVEVILDEALLAHAELNFHPLDNSATTRIARGDLIAFLEATGHPPRILSLQSASQTQ
ncbi:prolyl-tRNA synthetase associated domain-containing protein [Afifella pfennigii]|uniref:prolyl-tRNA synthetase associated domain-containing protein n=1 Tax=Afifella pfennigii TaxID=209897 RepID=UPI00047ED640|nr:prolyl-tRNA synthetase associated domain-containing protein [Afifella pfennigii]